ncbi:hypothetical protein IQ22_01661 [Pseudomonas duriflava]|uniref:Uncharacterized protein n=1 Tax=Pseudomonas duriflava TaxID=459528 RepID=A0A562QG58_9PSED|nr:hypothetical protein [Pseudomonas duriflava]TWI55728.1 hypothetical protein IQ22_01661 [Pseudomonas duriflava]
MRAKDNTSKQRREGTSILEWLVIGVLSAYIVFGLGLFVTKQWNALSDAQKEQIIQDIGRAAVETPMLT